MANSTVICSTLMLALVDLKRRGRPQFSWDRAVDMSDALEGLFCLKDHSERNHSDQQDKPSRTSKPSLHQILNLENWLNHNLTNGATDNRLIVKTSSEWEELGVSFGLGIDQDTLGVAYEGTNPPKVFYFSPEFPFSLVEERSASLVAIPTDSISGLSDSDCLHKVNKARSLKVDKKLSQAISKCLKAIETKSFTLIPEIKSDRTKDFYILLALGLALSALEASRNIVMNKDEIPQQNSIEIETHSKKTRDLVDELGRASTNRLMEFLK